MYEFETVATCYKLVHDMFKAKPGETMVITCDTESDMQAVEACANACVLCGVKPVVMKIAAPRGVGKAADPDMPVAVLTEALCAADMWVEFNNKWIFYSSVYDAAVERNKKLRYICWLGAYPAMMMRMIGHMDIETCAEFHHKVEAATAAAKHVHITTPAGTDVEFDMEPGRPFWTADGLIDKPGDLKMVPGQISWTPKFGTIQGRLVFDGAMDPGISDLDEPIVVDVKDDFITNISGGQAAKQWEAWLKSLNDPNMYRVAHASYGLNPGSILSRVIAEDERIWGCVEFGFGNIGDIMVADYIEKTGKYMHAASHCDGIALNSTVWLDDKLFFKDGEVVGPTEEIVELAKKLRSQVQG